MIATTESQNFLSENIIYSEKTLRWNEGEGAAKSFSIVGNFLFYMIAFWLIVEHSELGGIHPLPECRGCKPIKCSDCKELQST